MLALAPFMTCRDGGVDDGWWGRLRRPGALQPSIGICVNPCAVLVPIDCLINQPLSEPVVMPAPSWCPTPLYRNLCQLMCCPGANRLSIQSYNQPSCKACVDTYAALVPFTIVVNHDGYRDVVGGFCTALSHMTRHNINSYII